MNIRIFGAILVILSCGTFGFLIAANHRREMNALRKLINALEFMKCELQYRLTPLPELCRSTAQSSSDIVKQVFLNLAKELENQISPDAERCMRATLQDVRDIPKLTKQGLSLLGSTLGHFDVDGQVKSLQSIQAELQETLTRLSKDQDTRLRSYQTLGLCAGAAIAILLI